VISGRHHDVRLAFPEHPNGVRTLNLFKRLSQSLDKVLVKAILDQVGQDFGICLGSEDVTAFNQIFSQGLVVFNYAVMDYDDIIVAITVGMGVFSGRCSMGGPACMTQTDMAFCAKYRFDDFFKVA
jgi:hypothetical protein